MIIPLPELGLKEFEQGIYMILIFKEQYSLEVIIRFPSARKVDYFEFVRIPYGMGELRGNLAAYVLNYGYVWFFIRKSRPSLESITTLTYNSLISRNSLIT